MSNWEIFKRVVWQRSGGHYLFWLSVIYLVTGLYCAVYYKDFPTQFIQIIWISCLALPFTYPPLGRWLNLSVEWDRNMFNMLKKKSPGKLPDNVVPFPKEPEHGGGGGGVPPVPEPKKPATTFYTLGMTSENRVEFKMGYNAITMNYGGITNMIEQLKVYQKQLAESEGIEE